MKKTFSKSELEDKALEVFKQYPTAKQLYATVDGNIFLEKNRAELHSKDTIYPFDRPVTVGAPADDSKKEVKNLQKDTQSKKDAGKKTPERISAETAIKIIEGAVDLKTLDGFDKDKRATVKAAYNTKKEALIKGLEIKE